MIKIDDLISRKIPESQDSLAIDNTNYYETDIYKKHYTHIRVLCEESVKRKSKIHAKMMKKFRKHIHLAEMIDSIWSIEQDISYDLNKIQHAILISTEHLVNCDHVIKIWKSLLFEKKRYRNVRIWLISDSGCPLSLKKHQFIDWTQKEKFFTIYDTVVGVTQLLNQQHIPQITQNESIVLYRNPSHIFKSDLIIAPDEFQSLKKDISLLSKSILSGGEYRRISQQNVNIYSDVLKKTSPYLHSNNNKLDSFFNRDFGAIDVKHEERKNIKSLLGIKKKEMTEIETNLD